MTTILKTITTYLMILMLPTIQTTIFFQDKDSSTYQDYQNEYINNMFKSQYKNNNAPTTSFNNNDANYNHGFQKITIPEESTHYNMYLNRS